MQQYYSSFYNNYEHAPDIYKPDDSTSDITRPADDFVVARTASGEVASRYQDNVWYLKAYAIINDGKKPFYFDLKHQTNNSSEIISDWKWLLFLLFYVYQSGKSSNIAVSTLRTYNNILRPIANFAAKNQCSMLDVFSKEVIFNQFIETLDNKAAPFKKLANLLVALNAMGEVKTGFKALSAEYVKKLKEIVAELTLAKQTPVLPNRIYSSLISQHFNLINDYLTHKEKIIKLLKKAYREPGYAQSRTSQCKLDLSKKDFKPFFKEAVISLKLTEYVSKYQLKDIRVLTGFLSVIQHTCKNMIHCFSGMRDNEAQALKYNCLKSYHTTDGRVVKIVGRVTKFTGTEKSQRWVTCEELEPVVEAARSITRLVANYIKFPLQDCPLFITSSYLPFSSSVISHKPKSTEVKIITFTMKNSPLKFFNDDLKIRDSDIVELEIIDPERAWRAEEEFQIGWPWNLTSHQWRRSLAVYGSESGMISLTSLKRQLAHMTQAMAAYYARREDAIDICGGDVDAFWKEYQQAKPVSQAAVYQSVIHDPEEKILGGHGSWMNTHKDKTEQLTIVEERKKLVKAHKNGDFSYQSTITGGCTFTGECDKRALRSLVGCLVSEEGKGKPCPHSVTMESKVLKLIPRIEQRLNYMDKESLEYRYKQNDLDILYRKKSEFEAMRA